MYIRPDLFIKRMGSSNIRNFWMVYFSKKGVLKNLKKAFCMNKSQ
jgi:hypothetical protein